MCPEAVGVRALLLRDQFNNDVVFTMVAGRCPSPRAKTRLVAPRGLVLASPCGVQRWAHQPARRGRASCRAVSLWLKVGHVHRRRAAFSFFNFLELWQGQNTATSSSSEQQGQSLSSSRKMSSALLPLAPSIRAFCVLRPWFRAGRERPSPQMAGAAARREVGGDARG